MLQNSVAQLLFIHTHMPTGTMTAVDWLGVRDLTLGEGLGDGG